MENRTNSEIKKELIERLNKINAEQLERLQKQEILKQVERERRYQYCITIDDTKDMI